MRNFFLFFSFSFKDDDIVFFCEPCDWSICNLCLNIEKKRDDHYLDGHGHSGISCSRPSTSSRSVVSRSRPSSRPSTTSSSRGASRGASRGGGGGGGGSGGGGGMTSRPTTSGTGSLLMTEKTILEMEETKEKDTNKKEEEDDEEEEEDDENEENEKKGFDLKNNKEEVRA